ncbi:MAG: DUF2007 domain-containing protein [Acidobacteria bacterium]|nr:DUF2007 domain-containing protein [Acidobacteriota bacterium]MCH8268234.1 DUF2007 domain-containing protein [Acidobacteriota bacterium]MCZ6753613.1 DUF2007 domain-containing protein [Acidobacteriota bacterium]
MPMDPDQTELSRQKVTAIFSTQDEMEARVVQSLLQAAGIESMMNSDLPPNLFPLQMGRIAKLEILVLESQAEQAVQLISQQESDGRTDD